MKLHLPVLALATPTLDARSLKLAVGLRLSSLSRSRERPAHAASLGASTSGVKPTGHSNAAGFGSTGSSS